MSAKEKGKRRKNKRVEVGRKTKSRESKPKKTPSTTSN